MPTPTKRKQIEAARDVVNKLIAGHASQGRIAAGLASEGYNGGYRDALEDCLLVLSGVTPNRHHFWNER
jgi:hypothetical protein